MNPATIPVLLDTDLGTNIDDAFGLCYLLGQPRCRLLGVTTVGRDSARRADLARALCDAWGDRSVPVLAGFEPPRSLPDRPHEPWLARLPQVPRSARSYDPQAAIAFLAETIRAHPDRITLLTIGPLTNLSRLLDRHPDTAALLRRVVSMCGLFGGPPPGYGPVETNVGLDPEAAARVFEARLPDHHVLGLEITGAFEMPSAEARRRLADSAPKLLHKLLEAWAAGRETVRFHDPLAAVALFAPELFSFRPARCAVKLHPPDRRGRTAAEQTGPDLPHRLLRTADYERFIEHLFTAIT